MTFRCTDRRGAATGRPLLVVHNGGQPLYPQLHRISLHNRSDRRQPLRLRLLAQHVLRRVQPPAHGRRRGLSLGDRSYSRLAEPLRVVDAPVRRQDAEVPVGPRRRVPLHSVLRRRRHAATVRRHRRFVLAHLRSYTSRKAAHSQNTVSGETFQPFIQGVSHPFLPPKKISKSPPNYQHIVLNRTGIKTCQ